MEEKTRLKRLRVTIAVATIVTVGALRITYDLLDRVTTPEATVKILSIEERTSAVSTLEVANLLYQDGYIESVEIKPQSKTISTLARKLAVSELNAVVKVSGVNIPGLQYRRISNLALQPSNTLIR